MARRNTRREALEAEVRKLHRAVGQKVSKIERRQGIPIREQGLDPRQSWHDKSTAQLRAYRDSLAAFNSRSNNYVRGADGAALPRARWLAYQRAERAYNAQADAWRSHVDAIGTPVPTSGQTPGEYLDQHNPRDRTTARGASRTYERIERDAGDITSASGLEKLVTQMEKKAGSRYLDERARAERATLKKMFEKTGDTGKGSLYNKIANMSNEDFILLIDTTDFMHRAGGKYAFREKGKPEWQSQVVEEYAAGMSEQISYVKKLAKDSANGGSREYTDTRARPVPIQRREYTDTNAGILPVQFNPLDTRARSNPIVPRDKRQRGDR